MRENPTESLFKRIQASPLPYLGLAIVCLVLGLRYAILKSSEQVKVRQAVADCLKKEGGLGLENLAGKPFSPKCRQEALASGNSGGLQEKFLRDAFDAAFHDQIVECVAGNLATSLGDTLSPEQVSQISPQVSVLQDPSSSVPEKNLQEQMSDADPTRSCLPSDVQYEPINTRPIVEEAVSALQNRGWDMASLGEKAGTSDGMDLFYLNPAFPTSPFSTNYGSFGE